MRSERKWKMMAQTSMLFHICKPYDAAVWVKHSVLAQKPASFPGNCLNGNNLSIYVGNLVFATGIRRESFKFSGMIVLCFLAEIFQDADLGEPFPILGPQIR
jgi:hypothetical protein